MLAGRRIILAKHFSGKVQVEENGTVFVNRPYIGFKHLINFLRTNRTNPVMSTKYDQNMFDIELKYWGIPKRKYS